MVDYITVTREYLARNRSLGFHRYTLNSREFVVYPEVFSPLVFEDSAFFLANLNIERGGRLLEVGCGCGVISVCAALNGAQKVCATDINPAAIRNTQENAKRHGVDAVVRASVGDLFEAVDPSERFDLIFWNAPFISAECRAHDLLEQAVFDPNYCGIGRFLAEGPRYLDPKGRLALGFSSTSGDKALIDCITEALGARLEVRASTVLTDKSCPDFSLELYDVVSLAPKT